MGCCAEFPPVIWLAWSGLTTPHLGDAVMMSLSSVPLPVTREPGPVDDFVPSRYALRVGDIDVVVISDGVLPLPAETLATNAAPGELAAWLDDMRQPPDIFKWPLNVV